VEKLVANPGLPIGIAGQETTKPGFGGQDLFRIVVILEQMLRRGKKNIIGQPEVPGVIGVAAGEGVIIELKIEPEILHAEKNLDAIVNPVDVLADVADNQKVGLVANFDIEPLAQKVVKEVAGF
jgi:hypothetical protein